MLKRMGEKEYKERLNEMNQKKRIRKKYIDDEGMQTWKTKLPNSKFYCLLYIHALIIHAILKKNINIIILILQHI